MNLLIFRTDIKSKKKVKSVQSLLNNHADILDWCIDLEDIDNVLRVEATTLLNEDDIIGLVKPHGYYIQPLMG